MAVDEVKIEPRQLWKCRDNSVVEVDTVRPGAENTTEVAVVFLTDGTRRRHDGLVELGAENPGDLVRLFDSPFARTGAGRRHLDNPDIKLPDISDAIKRAATAAATIPTEMLATPPFVEEMKPSAAGVSAQALAKGLVQLGSRRREERRAEAARTASAPDLLDTAAKHMRDRAATYDKPEGERSMAATVAAFNAQTGRDLTEAEGWLLMVNLKIVRDRQRPRVPHRDSIEDLAAYSALMGEARLKETP